jgi:hypothetical protein
MAGEAEPERPGGAQIQAIMAAVNLKSSGETAGTTGEIEKASGLAMNLHQLDSLERFESANEDGSGGSRWFANHVEHEMRSIVKENVGVALAEIHGADAQSGPAEMVPGGIAGRISFGFDDASGEPPRGEIVNDNFSNQKTRESDRVLRKFRTTQTTDEEFCVGCLHSDEPLWSGGTARDGHHALQVFRGEEIAVFGVFAEEVRDVGAKRHNTKLVRASKIERCAR